MKPLDLSLAGPVAKSRPSRRRFIQDSSLLVAGSAVAGPLSLADQVHVGGSDEIRIGLLGCGQRGTTIVSQALSVPGTVRLVAMGDVFQDRLQASLRGLKGQHKDKVDVPRDRQYVGFDAYRALLQTELDLVILAAPPGFRPLHFAAAVQAGKHVFLEKPLAVDAPGVRRVLQVSHEAQRKQLAVAVGLQHRHEQRYQETIRRLRDGAIGDIVLTRVYRNSEPLLVCPRHRDQTELAFQLRNWPWFTWLGGDVIVDRLVHSLDVINWLKDDYPVSAQGQGGHLAGVRSKTGEIFDHHMVEFTYADGSKLVSQCRHVPQTWNRISEHAHGTHGTADLSAAAIRDCDGRVTWSYGRGGTNGLQQQLSDLLQQIRRGESPNEASYGAGSTLSAILGRMASYSGQLVTWAQALNCGDSQADHAQLASLDDPPPVLPDAQQEYHIRLPGIARS